MQRVISQAIYIAGQGAACHAVGELPLLSMAGLGVGLFVVLTGILFLDSVWCWEWIGSDTQQHVHGAAEWVEQLRSPSGKNGLLLQPCLI